jgi:hypothetical protein
MLLLGSGWQRPSDFNTAAPKWRQQSRSLYEAGTESSSRHLTNTKPVKVNLLETINVSVIVVIERQAQLQNVSFYEPAPTEQSFPLF